MELLSDLGGAVEGFSVGERYIDCICGRELLKLDKTSGEAVRRKAVFEKDGLSRRLLADGGQVFIYDFCTFYAFGREDFELLGRWRLGDDLSSDICGMAADEDTVYCSIRNGKIAAIDRKLHQVRESEISESSMWSLAACGGHLACGTVDGRLLLLDRDGLRVEKELVLGKKNVASLCLDGGTMYAACQDGKLFRIDMERFEAEASAGKAHRKMFRCAGLWGDMLATVSYPCSEIALWDKGTLEKARVLEVPLKLSGCAHIEGDAMYISSRNIPGIGVVRLEGAGV